MSTIDVLPSNVVESVQADTAQSSDDVNKKSKYHKHRVSNLVHKKKHLDATRKHRFKPGTVALREIRHLQKSVNHQIPRIVIKKLVKEIMGDLDPTMRVKRVALDRIWTMVEADVVQRFQNAQTFAIHSKHLGVSERDYKLALHFRNEAQLKGVW